MHNYKISKNCVFFFREKNQCLKIYSAIICVVVIKVYKCIGKCQHKPRSPVLKNTLISLDLYPTLCSKIYIIKYTWFNQDLIILDVHIVQYKRLHVNCLNISSINNSHAASYTAQCAHPILLNLG
jgi:hypothetical protein